MPKPNFEGASFPKSKDQYIIGSGHEEDLNYELMGPGPGH